MSNLSEPEGIPGTRSEAAPAVDAARVVISRGVLELLEPAEVEAVVAHELGHARNWDMVLMTIAGLVPLLAYSVFRQLSPDDSSDGDDHKRAGLLAATARSTAAG